MTDISRTEVMKKIAIHQPNYLPWLGYFYKIYQSDCFVFLDDVQYSNEGMHNYNYIKTGEGRFRLKIPVYQTLGNKIMEVRTKDQLGWKERHLELIKSNYGKAPFFDRVYKDIRDLIWQKEQDLSEFNISIIKFLCSRLSINCEFVKSSGLSINERKEERIIRICKTLGGEIYYSGTGARAYQSEENFRDNGIELRYSEFRPFKYDQLGDGFIPNLSSLDFLMSYGYDWNTVLKHQKPE